MNTPHERKEKIRQKAHELGFPLFGVTRADNGDPDGHFARWLDAGHNADLDYMARRADERIDPDKLVPGVRSIIALGMFYRWDLSQMVERPSIEATSDEEPLHAHRQTEEQSLMAAPPDAPTLTGDVSCYAWGADYHRVVIKKARKLREEIKALFPGATLYNEVDTGPVLEKVWAARAGLGWYGKHSNILSKNGSWFFLAVIMTDVELPEDQPVQDHCGSCTRCIDLCPTKAIIAPGIVDARRCISFLTIENKRGIPRELRPQIGRWVFGCDDCQLVCPWQKFDPGSTEPKFKPRQDVARPDLIRLLHTTIEEFTQIFQGTPIARAGLRGMRRNVLVALGNLKDASAIEHIAPVLCDEQDEMLRGHAAWALGQLGAKEILLAARDKETDASVLDEIDAALSL